MLWVLQVDYYYYIIVVIIIFFIAADLKIKLSKI